MSDSVFRPAWSDEDFKSPYGKSVSVKALIEAYFQSPRYAKVSAKTKQNYNKTIERLEKLKLYDGKSLIQYKANKVTYKTVDYLHVILAQTLKPATIKFTFSVLSVIWENAMRQYLVGANPWLRNQVRVDNQRDITWTKEQIDKAYQTALDNNYDVLALYILFAYETAQRPWADLRNLKWDNIKGSDTGYVIDFVISKTNTHMVLPVSKRLEEEIDKLVLSRANDLSKNFYVFVDKTGQRPTGNAILGTFVRLKKLAGLPEDLQFRDIRRTALTELVEAGATRDELRSIGGWKSDTVIPRYARIRYATAVNGMQKRWGNVG